MPVDFSKLVYLPTQDLFGRVVIVDPIASQPGCASYTGRGIFDLDPIDVQGLDGSIISESRVVLDIREAEYPIPPLQGDVITVPADSGLPDEGAFVVIDTDSNGGGETTLTLRHVVLALP